MTVAPENPQEDLVPDIVITGKLGDETQLEADGVSDISEDLPQFTFEDIQNLEQTPQELSVADIQESQDLPQFTFEEVQASSPPLDVPLEEEETETLPQFNIDEVVENEETPTEDKDLGWWANYNYAYDSTLGLSREFSDWAVRNDFLGLGDFGAIKLGFDGKQWREESTILGKLGAFVTTPEEMGAPEGWQDKSPDEIRQIMEEIRKQQLEQKYPEVTAQGGARGAAGVVGTITSALVDPTTALPIGQTVKASAGIGTALGGAFSYFSQERETGEVDPLTVATTALLAGAGSAAFTKAAQILRIKLDQNAIDKAKVQVHATVDKANDMLAQLASSGKYTADEALDLVATKMGMKPNELQLSARAVNRNITFPDKKTADLIVQTKMLKDDPLAARPLINQLFQGPSNLFNSITRPIDSAIRAISNEVDAVLNRYDYKVHRKAAEFENRASAFIEELKKLSTADQNLIQLQLSNRNFSAVERILANRSSAAVDSFNSVRQLLDDILDEMNSPEVGLNVKGLENYFPRKVIDLQGLRQLMGTTHRTAIEEAEKQLLAYLNRTRPDKLKVLPESERVKLLNEILEGQRRVYTQGGTNFRYERLIDEVTEDMLPYYASPTDSLVSYLHKSALKIEQAKLFGKSSIVEEGGNGINIEASIGAYLHQLKKQGKITRDDEAQLADLIATFFGPGQQAPSEFISSLKAFSYIPTLGNFQSTLTQIKDLGMAAYSQGFVNTVRAAIPGLGRGKETITAEYMGLRPIIAKEFSDSNKMVKALTKILKATGFQAVDGFGKKTTMNAALLKWEKASKTREGQGRLFEKYGVAFPEDFNLLVNDLKAGKTTARTELLAFMELTRTQPISPYRMPKGYLANPDWRIAYTLKSFWVRQLNLVREEIISEASRNPTQAAVNLTRYAVMLNLAGIPVDMVKDMIMGRPIDQERISNYAVANTLAFAGVNPYMWEKYLSKGDVSGFVAGTVAPPLGQISDVVQDIMDITKEPDDFALDDKPPPTRTLGNLPFAGPYIENYLGGGRQRALKEQERKEFQLDD